MQNREHILDKINSIAGLKATADEPMSNHTTFRVGGSAAIFVEIQEEDAVVALVRMLSSMQVPFYIVGNGSNLLISDEGYDGVIIEIGRSFTDVQAEGDSLIAQSGALLCTLSTRAMNLGLSGLEFASGIPGTLGGAIVMNAGAYGDEVGHLINWVRMYDIASDSVVTYDRDEMQFGYRASVLRNRSMIVLSASLQLRKGEETEIRSTMDKLSALRRSKQPLEYASAGSTFKRPAGGFAGTLIEQSGLKGTAVGDAEVSSKHAGFIINKGQATATDIYRLIRLVQSRVHSHQQIWLEPEVIMLGEFDA